MMENKYFRFGKSLASVQLASELEKSYPKTNRKISRHIHQFCEGLNALAAILDISQRRAFADLWFERHINHELLINDQNTTFNFDGTMKNVINYRYRLWLEINGGMNKKELNNRQSKTAEREQQAIDWINQNIKS